MLALVVTVLLELLVGLALARFGRLGLVTPVTERHIGIVKLFARSLWLGKGQNCRVPLARVEAPRLFALLDSLAARLGLASNATSMPCPPIRADNRSACAGQLDTTLRARDGTVNVAYPFKTGVR